MHIELGKIGDKEEGGKKVKHTPGPWKVVNNESAGVQIHAKVEYTHRPGVYVPIFIAPWRQFTTKEYDEKELANARLVAAAPDMYKVLQKLTNLISEIGSDWTDPRQEIRECHRIINEVLAKAEGKEAE